MGEKLTADEIRLIAQYGFQGRLDTVMAKIAGYQYARKRLMEAEQDLATAQAAMAAAMELADQLPGNLRLLSQAKLEVAQAEARRKEALDSLPEATEALFAVAGDSTPTLIIWMEQAGWDLTRRQLMAALNDQLSV